MCGSRKYPYLPHGRLFDLHPPHPQDFPFHGAFDDPPLLKNFYPLTTLFVDPPLLRNFPPFLPPSEIQSSFSTYKKEVNTNSVAKHGRSYHNSVMEV